MTVVETKLKGCFIIQPTIFKDNRGYFQETFNQRNFQQLTGLTTNFVQDNESLSSKGVLRGLHFQKGEHAQAKLVRVIKGRVLDVAVDLRRDSLTYGQHVAIELSESNNKQFFVPRGFAHGFVVLEDHTLFSYKCDNFYNKASEGGILYNDATLNIDWILDRESLIVSEKDQLLPSFESL